MSWGDSKIKGDKFCQQVEDSDGEWVNHGVFKQYYKNGKVAYEGGFVAGKKEGVWSFYNDKGEKKAEKFYQNGVEKAAPVH